MVTRDAGSDPGDGCAPGGAVVAAGLATLTLGGAVLVGWATGSVLLLHVRPGLPAMQPTSAVCLLSLGLALVGAGVRRRRLRRLTLPFALAAAVVAGLCLLERATGVRISPRQVLFVDAVARDPNKGEMALATSLLVLVLSAALVVATTKPPGHALATQTLGLAALTGSVLAVLDHLYGERAPYLGNVRSVMAVHTAAGLTVVAAGILAAVPGGVVPRVLHERGPGSTMRRRLLAAVAIALPAVGWLRLEGERLGLYGTSFGVAVIVVAAWALVCAAAWWSAGVADRSGAMLRDAWHRLGSTNAGLERRVAQQAAELAETRAQVRTLLDAMPDAVLVRGPDGRVALANARAGELLGLTAADLVGQRLDGVVDAGAGVLVLDLSDGGDLSLDVTDGRGLGRLTGL